MPFRVTLGEMDIQTCVFDKVLLKVKFLVWLLLAMLSLCFYSSKKSYGPIKGISDGE